MFGEKFAEKLRAAGIPIPSMKEMDEIEEIHKATEACLEAAAESSAEADKILEDCFMPALKSYAEKHGKLSQPAVMQAMLKVVNITAYSSDEPFRGNKTAVVSKVLSQMMNLDMASKLMGNNPGHTIAIFSLAIMTFISMTYTKENRDEDEDGSNPT